MPFAEGNFGAAYATDATCHAPSLSQVYQEVAMVLKPGGRFLVAECGMKDCFDEADERYVAMRNRIEGENALVNLGTIREARQSLIDSGFEVEHEEDFIERFDAARRMVEDNGTEIEEPQSLVLIPFNTGLATTPLISMLLLKDMPFPPTTCREWTWPLEGKYALATTWTERWTTFEMSQFTRRLRHSMARVGEKVGIWDKGAFKAMEKLFVCVDSVVEGHKKGIFMPGMWFLARKVEVDVVDAAVAGIARTKQNSIHLAEWKGVSSWPQLSTVSR
jgi:SAM-dependent methyltransferase